jgi:hypothetical protein
MARFIVDIASIDPKDIKKICVGICDRILEPDINYGMVTVNCIDESNDNQFYNEFDNGKTNELSIEQINNFKLVCNDC